MYDITKPLHSIIELKKAVDSGEVKRPDVLPLLSLDAHTDIRSPIVKGWLMLYTGKPKIGKTELLFQTILNWSEERGVIWFTEEGVSVWVEKLLRTPASIIRNDFTIAEAYNQDTKWIQNVIKKVKPEVVIIDTIKLLGIVEENKPSEVRAAFKPYYNIAHEQGITIILIHHDRKEKGKYGDQISGSNSFSGSVDVTISIDRYGKGKNDSNKRIAYVSGRASGVDFVYQLNDKTGEMEILGTPDNLNVEAIKPRVLPLLSSAPLTTQQLRDMIVTDGRGEVSRNSVLKALTQLAEKGEIERIPPIEEGSMKRKTAYWIKEE